MSSCPISVSAFYKFVSIGSERLQEIREVVNAKAGELQIRGLLLLAEEGINATVAGTPDAILEFKQHISAWPEFSEISFKDSYCSRNPFRRFKVDLRKEIVTSGDSSIKPWESETKRLSPREWQEVLEREKEVVLIDTRNFYETEVGKFKNAIDPGLDNFGQFKHYVEQLPYTKDKKILIYCTGGIRCEKAAIEFQRAGFENVYQLDGGILKYLEEFPHKDFEGECFVFDHRVAVDQTLQPSRAFKLCPHCGNPATQSINCIKCKAQAVVCRDCLEREFKTSCSKNCANHLERKAKQLPRQRQAA